jgi:hypothetical protein
MFLCLLLTVFTACGATAEIEDTLHEFQLAANTNSLSNILECIDPKIANPIKTVVGVVGLFKSDVSIDKYGDQLVQALMSGSDVDSEEFFTSLDIEVQKVDRDGDKAEVDTKTTYTMLGQPYISDTTFKMVERDDVWYVQGIKLFNTKDKNDKD